MTDREYAADCIEFLRELASWFRSPGMSYKHDAQEISDKLDEIATSLQIDTQEETK